MLALLPVDASFLDLLASSSWHAWLNLPEASFLGVNLLLIKVDASFLGLNLPLIKVDA